MPEQQQDMLEQALQNLQAELTAFGKVQGELRNAHEQLAQAQLDWNKLTQDQKQTAQSLVSAVCEAVATAHGVIEKTDEMIAALIPLARAITSVNFPMRLDKIDMAVSTQASAITNLQGSTEKGLGGLRDAIATVERKVASGFEETGKAAASAGKRQKVMLALLVANTILIAGAVVFFLLIKFGVLRA